MASTHDFGEVHVTVEDDGEGVPPWGHQEVHRYRVVARHGRARFSTIAWGSITDTQTKKHKRNQAAALALAELLSAATDSEEYVQTVMGEATGREAMRRGRAAERAVRAAKRFPLTALESAGEAAKEKGLL